MLSLKQGIVLVSLAREAVNYFFKEHTILPEFPRGSFLKNQSGAFVTLNSFPELELRGCVGYALPVMPLQKAIIQSALAAAFQDSRFSQLKESELSKTVFEVSVLSKPSEIKEPKEKVPEQIVVGKHGLIVSKGSNSGLLLPQVAVEYDWNSLQFLEECCQKAGLEQNAWLDEACKIQVFEAQVFKETEPEGKVVEEVFEKN